MNALEYDQYYSQLSELQKLKADHDIREFMGIHLATQKNNKRIAEIRQRLELGEEK